MKSSGFSQRKNAREKILLRSSDDDSEYSGKRMYVFSLVSIISTSTFIATVAMSMLATLVCPGMSAWVLALAASRMQVKMR